MLIDSLGSVGMGLVWGWLLVLIGGSSTPGKRPFRNFLALSLATIIFGLHFLLFGSEQTLFLFLLAVPCSLILHLAWRQSLRSS
jgi:hypothetical protein